MVINTMSPFKLTIQKGDKTIIENQRFQFDSSGVYLCVVRNFEPN